MQIQTTRSARTRVSSAAKALAAVAAFAVASAAQAHPGHGAESFAAGLAHPFGGLDHLLAMVAVGMWSVVALPKAWRTAGPAVFLAALLPGAALAAGGIGLPWVEAGIALSVVVLALLMLNARRIAPATGFVLVAMAGVLHGQAHGAELAGGHSFMAYAGGFMAASALLHATGLWAGTLLQRLPDWAWRTATALIGGSGLLMLAARV
ncbi:HupE/UreJ family protein [Variovorax paradoxus]|uniref:HupE/UreJ family protein n=1 Tax=Variovorax paradoxus TaxID=34073 RepID=UPI00037C3826|nr:HupE/UreJ family protein [Variovorax paradoxus]